MLRCKYLPTRTTTDVLYSRPFFDAVDLDIGEGCEGYVSIYFMYIEVIGNVGKYVHLFPCYKFLIFVVTSKNLDS